MRWLRLNITFHKWLSLLVGLQLIIWLLTGLYFNLMDEKKATGNVSKVRVEQSGNVNDFKLISISGLDSKPAEEIALIWVLEHPYFHVVYEKGVHNYEARESVLFDAVTGERFSLNESLAFDIAKKSYAGEGQLQRASLQQPPFEDDVRQQNPMWQVVVDDDVNTVIYLDGVTGSVLKHVTDDVRLKDFMMKLHFMDYGDSGGFNHWLIVTAAITALALSVSGFIWLIQLFKVGQLRLTPKKRRQAR